MKAIGVTTVGGPEALHVVELPEPHAGPGEIRIRVHAATVNPTDTLVRAGGRAQHVPPPYVPGMDAAGVVDQVGEGVSTGVAVGDHVMAIVAPSGSYGAYSELVVVPAESAVPVPSGASDVEAATLPMNGLTARLALDLLALRSGQHLGVTGAAGAVGGYAIQLGRAEGLHVVADAAPADEELVRSLGAEVVLPRGDDYPARVRDAVPGGVDGLVDAALFNQKAAPAVREGGMVTTVRGYHGRGERGIVFRAVGVREYARNHAALDRLRQQAESGELTLRVARTFPADQAAEAHRLLEAGGVRGRLVLEF